MSAFCATVLLPNVASCAPALPSNSTAAVAFSNKKNSPARAERSERLVTAGHVLENDDQDESS
jgi:hypothetical protein